MSFRKDDKGNYLTLYRGECEHPNQITPRARGVRALYFGDIFTANAYSWADNNTGDYYTSRVYPVHLVLNQPFVNQPKSAYLELSDIVERLGRSEAVRIADRFAQYVTETDNWQLRINKNNKYKSVMDYINSPEGDLSKLYFQAYRFFDSLKEVRRLAQAGYDGAIHAGCGHASAGRVEYCVFKRKQVFFTTSKSYLENSDV